MFNLRSIEQGYNFVLLVSKYSWPITELHTTNKHCMYTEKSFETKTLAVILALKPDVRSNASRHNGLIHERITHERKKKRRSSKDSKKTAGCKGILAIRRKAWRENAHAYPSVKHEHRTWTYPSPTPRHDCSQWDRAISAALAVRERGRREEKHTRQLGVSPFEKWNRSDLSIRPNSSIEHQHFSPNRNSSPLPRPSLLRSFFSSFFLLLYLSHSPSPLARPVYAKQRRTHGRKYIRTVYHRDRPPSTV